MKAKDIPYPCRNCNNMRARYLHMNGEHDFACIKKPQSEYGNPECDKLEVREVEE